MRPRSEFRPLVTLLLLAITACGAGAQAPTVDRIDPPNWWTGMRWDSVQLMVYGSHLDGVAARFVGAEGAVPEVVAVHPAASPRYAFIDVRLPDGLAPGEYTLELVRDGDTARVAYPVRARETAGPRHQGFSAADVIYLAMPDRFADGDPDNNRVDGMRDEYDRSRPGARHGGDLQGIIDHLDYLEDLGVTALWLNPVLENRGRGSYHGYAATDLYAIDARLGTNQDYRRLVAEAHRRGIKVIFDHVNNHIGIAHPWIGDLPTASWLNGSVDDHLTDAHYKLSVSDPHADSGSIQALKRFWFVDGMPDLNQHDPFLATYLIQNTLWWIEYTGLDGIREDTYPYPFQDFLADWAAAILAEYPDLNIVGEIWDGAPAYVALFQQSSPLPRDFETNLQTVMDFPLSDAWRAYMAGTGSLEGVYRVLAQDFLYGDPASVMTLVDNHDMPRALYVADGNVRKVKQALTMLLTTRGIPQILYGTEIGMVGGESHVELRADMPGGFPGDERSVFDPEGRTPEEADMFDFLQQLLHLRQEHPALTRGDLTHYPPQWNNNVYRYLRSTPEETILVVVNGYEDARRVDLSELADRLPARGRFVDLMTGRELTIDLGRGVDVEGWGVRVLQVR